MLGKRRGTEEGVKEGGTDREERWGMRDRRNSLGVGERE